MSDDGGPAFPSRAPVVDMDPDTQRIETVRSAFDGMSLRDYFAAAALTGLLADRCRQFPEREGPEATDWREAAAIESYRFADAMLEARKAKP